MVSCMQRREEKRLCVDLCQFCFSDLFCVFCGSEQASKKEIENRAAGETEQSAGATKTKTHTRYISLCFALFPA